MEKNIKLTLEQAKKLYGKNPEMDELLLANFIKEELTEKELPTSWYDLDNITWAYIRPDATIRFILDGGVSPDNKNVFAKKEQAKSALAMAQLSQLMYIYNDGWEPDWSNLQLKYCIVRTVNKLTLKSHNDIYQFLAFKTSELAEKFLKNFEPLIKEYFMID